MQCLLVPFISCLVYKLQRPFRLNVVFAISTKAYGWNLILTVST
jgi:hypothetical protein